MSNKEPQKGEGREEREPQKGEGRESQDQFDLEDRLIEFAVRIIKVADALPATPTGNHIRGQILRSGTAPAPNYAEAQSAESRADFVHKIKIALKELRETKVWLRIILNANLIAPPSKLEPLILESDELISIFVTSVKTASQKLSPKRKN